MFSRRGEQVSRIHCDLAMFVDEASDGQAVDDAHVSNASIAGCTSLQPRGSEEVVGNHEQDANTSEAHLDNNVKPTHKAAHRTGTGPYMAIDLLVSKETPRHLYQHDLESYLFIATWFCAAFIPEEHVYDYQHEILKTWEDGTSVVQARAGLFRAKAYIKSQPSPVAGPGLRPRPGVRTGPGEGLYRAEA
jgi:hypothetical protein